MPPRTLLDLARKNGVDLPADSEEGVRRWFEFDDFEHFVEIYLTCSRVLQEPEDFQRLVGDFAVNQAEQNVLASEVYFTIGTHLMQGGNGDEIADALREATEAAGRSEGTLIRWIPDIVRNAEYRWADATVEWALEGPRPGVVALGLSGIESFPDDPFRAHFEAAAEAGLHRVAHAGEHRGPESIRSVLDVCGAERIGHGIRCLEDPELAEELAATGIPLEVCPTSNLSLGVVPDLESHPFDRLRREGNRVTVNSDDPALFATSLSEEFRRLGETFSYSREQLARLAMAGLEASFLPSDVKEDLERESRRQLAELGVELEDEEEVD